MERKKYIDRLFFWKSIPFHKPLILEGARQVGKTWLMTEFARKAFKNAIYLRFDKNATLRGIFNGDFDIGLILHELEIFAHTQINPADTILLFDEIQSCKNALTCLKYFQEERPDISIIAAGSLLGLTYRDDQQQDENSMGGSDEGTGYPVGKVTTLPVYPMTFQEFLVAVGESTLAEEVEKRNWKTIAPFHERLITFLRQYYIVGGMPEAVLRYIETHDLEIVRQVQQDILSGYRRDISKHAPKQDVPRIEMLWNSIPAQLAKENKHFFYSDVKAHGRANEFRSPLAWLEDAGLIHINRRVTVPRLPLASYNNSAFKVFLLDVGLLSALSHLDYAVILEGPRIFTEFKGSLTEQYVMQELVATPDYEPHYWSTEDSRTEVDFLYPNAMEIIPLEVKAEQNVRSQSLKSYLARFCPTAAIRVSMLPYIEQDMPVEGERSCRFLNVPLYAVNILRQALDMQRSSAIQPSQLQE